MGDATRNLSQQQEMDRWLAKLTPALQECFAKMYKSFENAEAAPGAEAAMDAAEDDLIQTARGIVESNEKASAAAKTSQQNIVTTTTAASKTEQPASAASPLPTPAKKTTPYPTADHLLRFTGNIFSLTHPD